MLGVGRVAIIGRSAVFPGATRPLDVGVRRGQGIRLDRGDLSDTPEALSLARHRAGHARRGGVRARAPRQGMEAGAALVLAAS